jgi:predicted DNA-binding protein
MNSMNSKLVALKIPEEVIQAIEEISEATGKDKKSIVLAGLSQFIELTNLEIYHKLSVDKERNQ